VALLSWMMHGKKLSFITAVMLITILIGLALMRNPSASADANILGILFAVLAAATYAIYIVGSKQFSSRNIHSGVLTVMVCLGCAFLFLIIALCTNSFIFPHSMKAWIYLLMLGILVTALPIQLMLEGLKVVSSMRASLLSVLEPLVTVLVGILFLSESVSGLQALGSVIVIVSALLVQLQKDL